MRVCLFHAEHISIWDDDIPTHCIYSQRHAWIGEMYGISNHWRLYCLPNRLFRHRSKKTSKLRVTGLCAGNSSVAGEFPAQRTSNAEMFPFDDVIMCSHYFSNTCETMIIRKKYSNVINWFGTLRVYFLISCNMCWYIISVWWTGTYYFI